MLHHMFVFGVVIPTVITIALFLGFLFCWFKFNMRERLFGKSSLKKSGSAKHDFNGTMEEMVQYTSDLEFCVKDKGFRNGPDSRNGGPGSIAKNDGSVTSNKARPYVNLQNVQEENNAAQSINQTLSSGITDSEADTDYPRLTEIGDYLSQDCCSGNQSIESAPSELENKTHNVNNLVQHTYHFPDVDKNCSKTGGNQDKNLIDAEFSIDSEDSCSEGCNSDNYGHFVPVSQIFTEGKEKILNNSVVSDNSISVI